MIGAIKRLHGNRESLVKNCFLCFFSRASILVWHACANPIREDQTSTTNRGPPSSNLVSIAPCQGNTRSTLIICVSEFYRQGAFTETWVNCFGKKCIISIIKLEGQKILARTNLDHGQKFSF